MLMRFQTINSLEKEEEDLNKKCSFQKEKAIMQKTIQRIFDW